VRSPVAIVAASLVMSVPGLLGDAGESAAPASPPSVPTPVPVDPPPAARARDVVDYTLHATLDAAAHTVHGEGTILWRNDSRVPVGELWVHLYLNAFKSVRSVWMRGAPEKPAGAHDGDRWGAIDVRRFALHEPDGTRLDLWPGAELHRPGDEDETDVRVPLPREVPPGGAITLDVVWDDQLPPLIARTGYVDTFHMVAQWFPKIARLEPDGRWAHFPFYRLGEFYADYGRYDVTLDVPASMIIGATGAASASRVEGGRRVERRVQDDVHDFAWTAWDRFQVAQSTIDGVAVSILHPPGYGRAAARTLALLRFALPWMSARFGAYPYPVLTVVQPPGWRSGAAGQMEYPTLLTTADTWYPIPWSTAEEAITLHELAHQWFYGLVGTNEVDWPFLDEGLASYAEKAALRAWQDSRRPLPLLPSPDPAEVDLPPAGANAAPIAQPAYGFESTVALSWLAYERSAALFGTIARVYGEDRLMRALGEYARRYRFEHPGPQELLETLGASMGSAVEKTLRAALFEQGSVDYTVVDLSSAPATAGGYDGEVLVQRRGTLSFPVEVALFTTSGHETRVRWNGESNATRIPFHGDAPLRAAAIDPAHAVLLDDDPTNDFATATGEPRAGAPRTFERALYWAELAMQAVP
jgi:hypothetical protein